MMSHRLKQISCVFLIASAIPIYAATLYVEPFPDQAGWTGTGFTTLSHDATLGHPGGTLVAEFNPIFFPLLGGARADVNASGGAFAGDYTAIGAQSINFEFYAADVAPTLLAFRLYGNSSEFYYTLSLPSVGAWVNYAVPLQYTALWDGGNAVSFENALMAVEWIEVTIQSTSFDSQSYYLDNIELSNLNLIPIPEPGYGLMGAMLLLLGWRRLRLAQKREMAITARSTFPCAPSLF